MRFPQSNSDKSGARQQTYPQVWAWVWSLVKDRKSLLLQAAIAVFGAAASLLGIARGAQFLVDKSLHDPSGHTLNLALLIMLTSAVMMALCSFLRVTSVNALSSHLGMQIRKNMTDKILTLDTPFFDTHKSGDLVSRMTTEVGYIQQFMMVSLPSGVRNGLLLLGGVVMMAATSWHLSLLALLAVPVLSVPIIILAPRLRGQTRRVNEDTASITSFLSERLNAMRTIRLFAAEDTMRGELQAKQLENDMRLQRMYLLRAILAAIVIILVFSLIAFILWSGGRSVLAGWMSQGEVAAFVMYAVIAARSMASLMELGQTMGQARAAGERLLDILAVEPAIKAPAAPIPITDDIPEIKFESIFFSYPHSAVLVLQDLSFTIKPRENVALVGPSGAGKSTIFALLTRLYDPQSGTVRINGVDIRDLDPAVLRRLFGVIPQEPDFFALSVKDNISYGLDENVINEALLVDAARAAHIHDVIAALPDGYDTQLGERGAGLSVGQKQRLAIARALLRDPKIMLMDEATSALDAESEQHVQDALSEAARSRTALVIAHRLATIRNAERILVLEKGRLIAEGTHDALVKQGGLYAHLAGLQFLDG